MGRDALALAVHNLDLTEKDTVLLPAFLCREVLKPFWGRTQVEFFDLRPDMVIDPDTIEKRMQRNKIKVMLIINYFGFLQPYRKEIRDICDRNNVLLIEDCAHSLLTEGSGDTGDILIYSFRKIIPVPDGGGLIIKNSSKIDARYYPKLYSNVLSILIFVKSLFNFNNEKFSRAYLTSRSKNSIPVRVQSKNKTRVLSLSTLSYNGIGNARFPEIVEKRRSDYLKWQTLSRQTELFKPVFPELDADTCPMGFPIKIEKRNHFKSLLLEKGIFLKTFWNLPEAVGDENANSIKLAEETALLPIYPELTAKDFEAIKEVFGL